MLILVIVLLIIFILLTIYNIYKIQTAEDFEMQKRLTHDEQSEKSDFEKSLIDIKEKLKISKEKLNLNNIEDLKSQFLLKREDEQFQVEYLGMLINAVIDLDKEAFKDFRLYNNISLDYFDSDTKKKTTIKIDHILLTPYGIITIKNIELEGLSFVDLNFSLDNKSKAMQIVSKKSNLKSKEFTHPVVDAIQQSKALSTFFISKNLPNAFITPIVAFTNYDEDYKNNSILLKLENGEYTLFDSICKINNLLGNSKNHTYMITPKYITRFLLELKNNMDISRPLHNYSTSEIYDFDLALLSVNSKVVK